MDFAKDHFNHNKARTKNDKELAYSWYNGLTGALKARQRKGALDNSPYVQTVMGYYKKPTAQQDQPMLDLEQKPATELAGIDALKRLLGHE